MPYLTNPKLCSQHLFRLKNLSVKKIPQEKNFEKYKKFFDSPHLLLLLAPGKP